METKQISFLADGEVFGGILVNDEFIICVCCGGVFEKKEVEVLKVYPDWVSISNEIIGE